MLGQIERPDSLVIADFEAGLGTVSRLQPDFVDLLLVVTEPTAKAVDVAARSLAMIRDKGLGRAIVIGNRVAGPDDRALLERTFASAELIMVPDDDAVRDAGLAGVAPYDAAGDQPAVMALRALAITLLADGPAPAPGR